MTHFNTYSLRSVLFSAQYCMTSLEKDVFEDFIDAQGGKYQTSAFVIGDGNPLTRGIYTDDNAKFEIELQVIDDVSSELHISWCIIGYEEVWKYDTILLPGEVTYERIQAHVLRALDRYAKDVTTKPSLLSPAF